MRCRPPWLEPGAADLPLVHIACATSFAPVYMPPPAARGPAEGAAASGAPPVWVWDAEGERTEAEAAAFGAALSRMQLWYAHMLTTVFIMTEDGGGLPGRAARQSARAPAASSEEEVAAPAPTAFTTYGWRLTLVAKRRRDSRLSVRHSKGGL